MRNHLEVPRPAAARRIVLKGRSVGKSMSYRVYLRQMVDAHLAKHGEPWRTRMTAPAYIARTALTKLVDLWASAPSCGGSCDQGRRACDCRGRP